MAKSKTLPPWWPMCANGCGAPAQAVRVSEYAKRRAQHDFYEDLEPGVEYVWPFCSPSCRREFAKPRPLDQYHPAEKV